MKADTVWVCPLPISWSCWTWGMHSSEVWKRDSPGQFHVDTCRPVKELWNQYEQQQVASEVAVPEKKYMYEIEKNKEEKNDVANLYDNTKCNWNYICIYKHRYIIHSSQMTLIISERFCVIGRNNPISPRPLTILALDFFGTIRTKTAIFI